MLYIHTVRFGLWLQTRLLSSCTRNILHRTYIRLNIEYVEAEAWLTLVIIMVQVEGYICYTLFNILCIITQNIIIINSHSTCLRVM